MDRESEKRPVVDLLSARVLAAEGSLSPTALRVARFIDQNRVMALASSAADLATSIGTSDATVIRAVQALGFAGLPELKHALTVALQQRSTPADDLHRTLADIGDSTDDAIDLVLNVHRESLDALQSGGARPQITAAVSTLHRVGRVVIFGIGPTAQLARYAALLLARIGRRACALDATGVGLADQLLDLRRTDGLLILAYGHAYQEVVATFAEARKRRLPIVLVTDSLDRKLARQADVVIPVRRGRADRMALHGTTLIALEAIILGLAAIDRQRALATLQHLNELRQIVNGARAEQE